jgi:hypothetical protein
VGHLKHLTNTAELLFQEVDVTSTFQGVRGALFDVFSILADRCNIPRPHCFEMIIVEELPQALV